jgi:hypothetical protein
MVVEAHFEQYQFQCEPCGREWEITYEVRDSGTAERGSHYFYLTGIPAAPPAAGRLCPNCWMPASPARRVELVESHR